jgi:uncharacterized protein (DUF433 family)
MAREVWITVQTIRDIGTAHIRFDERGVAWIDHTGAKVIELMEDKLANGASPEELHSEYPHLSLAQIHAALSYYYDHREELDAEMMRRFEFSEAMRAKAEKTLSREQLLARRTAKAKSIQSSKVE